MKTILKIVLVVIAMLLAPQKSEAQFLKRALKKAQDKIEREADKRTERRINKGIDKSYDEVEETIDGKNGKKKKKGKDNEEESDENQSNENTDVDKGNADSNDLKKGKKDKKKKNVPKVVWSKFDFVPGDTVIFEDSPSADEENGEFPSRWDLESGQVEIAEVDGEPVMIFLDGSPTIIPYLKNSKEDYLPEVFTIEFDFYKPKNGNRVSIFLYDVKNQKSLLENDERNMYMDIDGKSTRMHIGHNDNIDGVFPGIDHTTANDARWIHISIAYTKGKLKIYMDDTRVINIPHYSDNPKGLTLQAYWADAGENKAFYFKNVRIAKGGVKYYDRVLSEGKIIVNGIKFDINKATLKPESMGPINKIYKLMVKNTDINFSVEGHTDSDGGDEANMKLSKERGKSVMEKLVSMGIDSSRLKYNGFGESKPIDNNTTAEGKANNRRVEFVKF